MLKLLITSNYVNIDWINVYDPSLAIQPKFVASSAPHTYDVFDMLGAHVGRIEATTSQDVSQKVRALAKQNGTYLVKSRNSSATIRVMK